MDVFAAFGLLDLQNATPSGAVTAVVTNTGAGKILARALVTDVTSGDVSDVIDWRLRDPALSSGLIVPYVRRDSRAGADSKTELVIMNGSTASTTATVEYRSSATEIARRRPARSASSEGAPATMATATQTVTIPAMQTVTINDVLSQFGVSSASSGALLLTVNGAAFGAYARITTTDGLTRSATSLPLLPATSALKVGQSRNFVGIEDASAANTAKPTAGTYHASFGLVEMSGKPATVRATLYFTNESPGSTTTLRGVVSKDYALSAKQVRHITDMAKDLIGETRSTFGDLHSMRLDLTVTAGDGTVLPYVILAENATGDPIVRIE